MGREGQGFGGDISMSLLETLSHLPTGVQPGGEGWYFFPNGLGFPVMPRRHAGWESCASNVSTVGRAQQEPGLSGLADCSESAPNLHP